MEERARKAEQKKNLARSRKDLDEKLEAEHKELLKEERTVFDLNSGDTTTYRDVKGKRGMAIDNVGEAVGITYGIEQALHEQVEIHGLMKQSLEEEAGRMAAVEQAVSTMISNAADQAMNMENEIGLLNELRSWIEESLSEASGRGWEDKAGSLSAALDKVEEVDHELRKVLADFTALGHTLARPKSQAEALAGTLASTSGVVEMLQQVVSAVRHQVTQLGVIVDSLREG